MWSVFRCTARMLSTLLGATVLCPVATHSAMCGDQEFDIPFRAGDRARDEAIDRPVEAGNPVRYRCAHTLVDFRVAHDTALAHFLAPGLELRLDERHQPCVRC